MSEFKHIESQEQFDSMVKDRLERKEASVRKEYEERYADYEALKAQSSSYAEQIEALTKERDEHAQTIKDLNSRIALSEMNTLKQNIASEFGIPKEMASRLNGDDEESLRKDASALASFVSAKPSPPRKSSENKTKSDDGYKSLVRAFSHE